LIAVVVVTQVEKGAIQLRLYAHLTKELLQVKRDAVLVFVVVALAHSIVVDSFLVVLYMRYAPVEHVRLVQLVCQVILTALICDKNRIYMLEKNKFIMKGDVEIYLVAFVLMILFVAVAFVAILGRPSTKMESESIKEGINTCKTDEDCEDNDDGLKCLLTYPGDFVPFCGCLTSADCNSGTCGPNNKCS
jgi:hypothetical protein